MTQELFYEIVKRHCQNKRINCDSKIIDDLGLCSFDLMMIVVEAEKEYGVHFTIQSMNQSIITIADFYDQFH